MRATPPKTAWTKCSDCGRVLWLEDGPTCPECLEKQKVEKVMARLERQLAEQGSIEIIVPTFPENEEPPKA